MQNTMEKPQGSFCPRPGQAHHGARGRQDGTRVESGPEPRVLAAHRDSQRDNYHPGTLSELVGMGAKEFVIEDFEMVEDEGKSDVDDPSLKMPNIAKSQQIDSPSLPVELKATPSPITVSGMPKLTGPEQSSICSSQRKRQRTRAYCLDSELNGGVPTHSAHKKQKTHDGASGDALENALMQQLTTPKRELNAEEHFNLPIAKDAAYLPDSARMAVRMCNAAGVGGGNEKISEKFQDVWLQRQLDGSAHQSTGTSGTWNISIPYRSSGFWTGSLGCTHLHMGFVPYPQGEGLMITHPPKVSSRRHLLPMPHPVDDYLVLALQEYYSAKL